MTSDQPTFVVGARNLDDVHCTYDVRTMPEDDDDFLRMFELDDYVAKPRPENPKFADVDIEISPGILDKISRKHGLTEDDVIDIVKGTPPAVVEAAHPDDGEKRQFYGLTRHDRDAFVVGVWVESRFEGRRRLRVVTAFLPDSDDYISSRVRR